jgi:hypothetical protein
MPPWSVEQQDACFVVKDGGGQQLAYVYFEDEPGRRSAAKLLTRQGKRSGSFVSKRPHNISFGDNPGDAAVRAGNDKCANAALSQTTNCTC